MSVRPSSSPAESAANPPVRNGRLKYTHVALKEMMTEAFPVDLLHIRGGPSWTDHDPYDVEAITSELSVPKERYQQMVQAMLADRFQLETHFEQRQETIYYLPLIRPCPAGRHRFSPLCRINWGSDWNPPRGPSMCSSSIALRDPSKTSPLDRLNCGCFCGSGPTSVSHARQKLRAFDGERA